MDENGKNFQQFLDSRQKDFQRIARESRGDCTADDVRNEAWLVAIDIERKRGRAVDFSCADDQDVVIGWLYRYFVTFADKSIRFAVKLDKGWESEGEENSVSSLIDFVAAPDYFDPIVRLESDQEQQRFLEIPKRSYSQFAAYIVLWCRAHWDLEEVAEMLGLVICTVRRRVVVSHGHMERQPSFFDGIDVVSPDFVPTMARGPLPVNRQDSSYLQLAWDFAQN